MKLTSITVIFAIITATPLMGMQKIASAAHKVKTGIAKHGSMIAVTAWPVGTSLASLYAVSTLPSTQTPHQQRYTR